MEKRKPRILIVEDSAALGKVYASYLRDEPYTVRHVEDGRSAITQLSVSPPQALLLDLQLPDMAGMDILKLVHDQGMPTSVVIITGHGSIDVAVDAMRYGAFDFIEKPFNARRLQVTLRNALDRQNLTDLVDRIKEEFRRDHYHGFIGSCLQMQAVYRIIDSAAPSKATVFITGESGTGKEVCADAIHRQSPRKNKPFVALNCGAIPRDLMESEIFGHVKGAFTGASKDRTGAAGHANGGTLFLDEIGEMDLDLQTKLLRFVQTGTFRKVGATQLETVDVRFVCATNRDPMQEVAAGRFREDLFYRLHVIPIHLPPLRERGEDIQVLALSLLRSFTIEEGKAFRGMAPEVEALFSSYGWPGNVRQLQNVIRNVVVLHNAENISMEMLPPPLNTLKPEPLADGNKQLESTTSAIVAPAGETVKPLWQVEKEAVERAIELCNGHIPRAAAMLEVSPSTIYRKRQSWAADEEPGS